MKNIFKFAAMAFAAVAMFAACEPEDKGNEKDALPTPDGKQWVCEEEVTWVCDFGVTKKDTQYQGMLYQTGENWAVNTMGGNSYTITPTDETSGVITLTISNEYGDTEPEVLEFKYSDLTETTVKMDAGLASMSPCPYEEMLEFTLATEKYNVMDPYADLQ